MPTLTLFLLPLVASLAPGARLSVSEIRSGQPQQLRASRLTSPTKVRLVARSNARVDGGLQTPNIGPSPDMEDDYLLACSAGARFDDYSEISSKHDYESSTWGCDYLDRDMADLSSHGAYR